MDIRVWGPELGVAKTLFSRAKVEITVNVFPRVYKFFVLAAAVVVVVVVVENKVIVRPGYRRTSVP